MDDGAPVRVDKWLWVARLVKTRALGAEAVKAGRVQVNGVPVKPSREVRAGDRLELRTGAVRRAVRILGTAPRRGPATEAQRLYEETEESTAAREEHARQRRLEAQAHPDRDRGGRPTKRDRRRYEAAEEWRRDMPPPPPGPTAVPDASRDE
jgi:ribosome-associated heat shock protein Hsp15